MKKILSLLLALGLMLSLAACGDEGETPPEPSASAAESSISSSSQVSEPSTPPESSIEEAFVENDEFYRNVVFTFGAEYAEGSTAEKPVIVSSIISLLFIDDTSDFAAMPQSYFFSWYLTRIWSENLSYEKLAEKYKNPLGEDIGWFFPEEYFEPLVQKYFNVSTEYLRADPSVYNAEHKGYWVDGGAGIGDIPKLTIGEVTEEGSLRNINLSLTYDYQPKVEKILTIELSEDGEYKFISYKTA